MTISYPDSFLATLLQWQGSLYKAVLKELLLFYFLYYCVFSINCWIIDDYGRIEFTKYIDWFEKGTAYIPLTFLLGFFVVGIVARWWEQFNWISWPDKLMMVLTLCLGKPEHRAYRRHIARLANLQAAMCWRMISVRTKKRFPTDRHLVDAGLMSEHELQIYQSIEAPYGKWFAPIMWITNLLRRLHEQGEMDSTQLKIVLKQLMSYRDGFAMLLVYDWVNIPLVYTQVVSIATYGYFTLCLVGRQPKLDNASMAEEATIWFPIFTTLQFAFYIGWLKVGQYLMHPFGEDEDDFELNWIIDRNTSTAYVMGDTMCNDVETSVDYDPFVTKKPEMPLPHTVASFRIKDVEPADNLRNVTLRDSEMALYTDDEFVRLGGPHNHGVNQEPINRFRSLVNAIMRRNTNRRVDRNPNDSRLNKGGGDEMESLPMNVNDVNDRNNSHRI